MNSCLYKGLVRHRRYRPTRNSFRYGLFMVYIDLDECDTVFDRFWLWSTKRPNLAWFKENDHFTTKGKNLKRSIIDYVQNQTRITIDGPVRLLTHLRYFGYCFNPVSFYFCFGKNEEIKAIVAEVNNTPWGERHLYLLNTESQALPAKPGRFRFLFNKSFHVSPFMPLDMQYDWRFKISDSAIVIHMKNIAKKTAVFDATLSLQKQAISSINLARALVAYPFMTGKVITTIYYQALKLWFKRTPFYSHPEKSMYGAKSHENAD